MLCRAGPTNPAAAWGHQYSHGGHPPVSHASCLHCYHGPSSACWCFFCSSCSLPRQQPRWAASRCMVLQDFARAPPHTFPLPHPPLPFSPLASHLPPLGLCTADEGLLSECATPDTCARKHLGSAPLLRLCDLRFCQMLW